MLEALTMVKRKNPFASSTLKDIPFFASFSPEQLQNIINSARIVSFKARQILFKQGENVNAIYVILQGGVKIEREDTSGETYALGELERGQVVGEVSTWNGDPSRATATVTMDTELLMIDRPAMLDVIRQSEPGQVLSMFLNLTAQTESAGERGFREVLIRRMMTLQMEVEKQRALTQMVAGVAHEINTPLVIINTAVNIMARELATVPPELTAQRAAEIAESLELMRLNVERADHLVQNFKKVSVSQLTDEKTTVSILEVIEETIGLISVSLKRNQIQIKLLNELRADQTRWIGYRGLLSQVLINLLTNVERYAYPNGMGGTVDVIIQMDAQDENFVLTVRDHGKGIPTENQSHVFEPFFTTGHVIGGTGLGLSLVHNIVVNIMKGEIHLNSAQGKGTEFIVIVPKVIVG
jgi:signal transduction histidine kinase